MYIHTSVFVSFKRIQYSTWCQNRGCICISSTRRTYRSNPVVSCIHSVIQTSNIILQTELFLQEEGKREIPVHLLSLRIQCLLQHFQCFHTQFNKFPVIPCKENYSTHRINSTTRNLQEILQLQGSSHTYRYRALCSNCSPCI